MYIIVKNGCKIALVKVNICFIFKALSFKFLNWYTVQAAC